MQTFCFNRRFALVRIGFLLTATHHNPRNVDTPLFQKAYRLFGSFSTWTVQNSLDNVVACLPLTQGCPPLLINSTTGQYNSTGTCMHSISLWSVFLASTQQGRALECAFVALNSKHGYALPCLPEIHWKPPKYRWLYNPDMQW